MNEPTPRQEICRVTNGLGRIEARSYFGANALIVDGRPVALDWPDNEGSIGHHAYLNEADSINGCITDLQNLVLDSGGTDVLSKDFGVLLQQFPSGTYSLTLDAMPSDWRLVDWDCHSMPEIVWYYPDYGSTMLVPTQQWSSLNEMHVLELMYRIEAGERPFLLTTSGPDTSAEFVIDGHHKLLAYCELRITPWRLRIAAVEHGVLSFGDWPIGVNVPRSWEIQFDVTK